MHAYSMLVTDVLTLSASPIALPASAPSPLSRRLQKVTHNRIMMTSSFLLTPPIMDAKTALPDVGDRRIDLEGLADRFAGLGTHVVPLEAGKIRP